MTKRPMILWLRFPLAGSEWQYQQLGRAGKIAYDIDCRWSAGIEARSVLALGLSGRRTVEPFGSCRYGAR